MLLHHFGCCLSNLKAASLHFALQKGFSKSSPLFSTWKQSWILNPDWEQSFGRQPPYKDAGAYICTHTTTSSSPSQGSFVAVMPYRFFLELSFVVKMQWIVCHLSCNSLFPNVLAIDEKCSCKETAAFALHIPCAAIGILCYPSWSEKSEYFAKYLQNKFFQAFS